MADLFHETKALQEATRRVAVDFLRTELQVAKTLLDVAHAGLDAQTEGRRRHEARLAYAEVERRLTTNSRIILSATERDELTAGLAQLARRLDSDS
jgi:hypothetical protein